MVLTAMVKLPKNLQFLSDIPPFKNTHQPVKSCDIEYPRLDEREQLYS
jgi:hypothetical protein